MISKLLSGAINGINGILIHIETDVSSGFPGFDIVGLPDSSVKEAKERVRAAIRNSGYDFPIKKITLNLAPANIKKEGSCYDLPIALGILCCMGVIKYESMESVFAAGELSLDGTIRPVNGILSMIHAAKNRGIKTCIVPFFNRVEAGLIADLDIYAPHNLKDLVHILNNDLESYRYVNNEIRDDNLFLEFAELDFKDVKGQSAVKRAAEICVSGGHNILMIGAPVTGKTMIAKRIPSIMPKLSLDESLIVYKIYSISGLLNDKERLMFTRPFRAPHHTISYAALTGGGRVLKPGEISLAHKGVLFLDELPEFQKNSLEALREPLEENSITISRIKGIVTYPADFMLVASMNPCPCGYYGDTERCSCSPSEVNKYLSKISGPLLDRIDIQIEVMPLSYSDINANSMNYESSADIRYRVDRARSIQSVRYKNQNISLNSELNSRMIDKYCILGKDEKDFLKSAFVSMKLSARGYHKILKVSRTIADLSGQDNITVKCLAEALQYRSLDRKYFG